MANDSAAFFSETKPVRLFFTAAVPGALGMLVSSIYGLMDGIFVGQFVGETAFAAVNLAMPFVIVNFAVSDLIGLGSSVRISIAHGKGERAVANNIFTCACLLNVITGLVTGLGFLLAAPAIMHLMGATGELARMGALYLRVYSAFLPITSICFSADNFLRICGRVRRSMLSNMLMALTGAVIEYILLGVLDLGVGAAALSYCIAMCVAVAVSLWPFFKGGMDLEFVRPHFSGRLVGGIVRDGIPGFLENVSGRITSIILNVALLAQGGEEAVSIYGVLMFTDGVIVPLIYGTVDSLQPAVGFNWGAKNLARVHALERCCFMATAALSAVYIVVCLAGQEAIVRIFVPAADAVFMHDATFALRLFCLSFVVRWLPFATQAYMVAVGQSRLASIVSVGQALVCPLIALAVLWPLGLTGLWLNMPAAAMLATFISAGVLLVFNRNVQERMEQA
ncbi:MAG: MATE family efflux transporter [Coriobacteriales bacterium]|nr:MATE family efflux transporter [Coriobacteriales bacterium]